VKKLLLMLLILCSGQLMAQGVDTPGISVSGDKDEFYRDTVWIVTGKRGLGPLFKKWKFDFVLDARRTFIGNQSAQLAGIRLGAEYRRVHRFGIGIYGLANEVPISGLTGYDRPIAEASVALSYASLFYERIWYFARKWEWSSAFHMGTGVISGNYRGMDGTEWQPLEDKIAGIFELSTIGYYNLTWWCNLGAGLGYREATGLQPELRRLYSAPVGILRVRIRLGKLVQSIWDRDKKYEY
jgi:hypothetical protein